MISNDEFLEHANVFGNYYGTARRYLQEAAEKRRDLLLDIDVQGAEQMKQKLPEAVSIFVLPPDRKTLERRLRNRSEDAEKVIARRLVTATREIGNYDKYDYILINDDLEESIESLQSIVLSERLLRSGRPLSPEEQKIVQRADPHRLANVRDRLGPILASFSDQASPARS
jgi:guanylate kinase